MPVRVLITEGTRADCKEAVHLIEGISAETLLADRGYDTNDILAYAVSAGMEPVIPPKRNRKEQHDTLNALCAYLDTTPDKLILYHPVDFRIDMVSLADVVEPFSENVDAEIKVNVIKNKRSTPCSLLAEVTCFYDEACPCFKISLKMAEPNNIDVFKGNNDIFLHELSVLPVSFKHKLESEIFDRIVALCPEHNKPVLLSFWWPI